jgi:hypothetical protein
MNYLSLLNLTSWYIMYIHFFGALLALLASDPKTWVAAYYGDYQRIPCAY